MAINATATQYVEFSATSLSGATTYTVRIARWLQHKLLNIEEYGEWERNADDTPISYGPVTNQKYMMTAECLLTTEEARIIGLINQVSNDHVRQKTGNEGITLNYLYKQIDEFGPRTRKEADGTVVTPFGTEAFTYYPKFLMKPRVFNLSDDVRHPRYTHQLVMELEEWKRIAP